MVCGREPEHGGQHDWFRPTKSFGSGRLSELSPRELQTLLLYADGATIAEIADSMLVSVQTIKNNLTIIYTKLDVGGHIDAFRAMGWLQVPA